MEAVPVNYLAILVCVVISMVLGFVWYSRGFLGKAWMKEAGLTDARMKESGRSMSLAMGLTLVGSLLMAWILAHAIVYAQAYLTTTPPTMVGIVTGFFSWLGFMVPLGLNNYSYELKSWKYFAITMGYLLILLLIEGAVLGAWR
jgi:hypothetical protein